MCRLFGTVKDKIYKGAANLISMNESEPYYLIHLFKRVQELDSSYLRQRLMIAIDEILEEKEGHVTV